MILFNVKSFIFLITANLKSIFFKTQVYRNYYNNGLKFVIKKYYSILADLQKFESKN